MLTNSITICKKKWNVASVLKKACLSVLLAGTVSATGAIAYYGIDHPFPAPVIFWQNWLQSAYTGAIGDEEQGIDQGEHGDCWFESAVAGLSTLPAGSRLLSDMIVKEGNGWRVTFLDSPDTHHMVTEADIAAANVRDKAKWAQILEAALFKRYPALMHGKSGAHVAGQHMHQEFDEIANTQIGLTMLTGHTAGILWVHDMQEGDLRRILCNTDGWHFVATAATPSLPDKTTPIPGNHCYSVLGYDPSSGTVWVRNPWGSNTARPEYPNLVQKGETKQGITGLGRGVLAMNITTFKKFYINVAYASVFHR